MIRSESRKVAEAVLAGFPERVGLEPQRYEDGDIVGLANWVREIGGRPRACPDPRHLARRMKIPVIDRLPQGSSGECTDGSCIWYRWQACARDRGYQVAHGLGHCAFRAAKWGDAEEADVIILAAELLLPEEVVLRVRTLRRAAAVSLHAPEWFLEAQITRVLLRGVRDLAV